MVDERRPPGGSRHLHRMQPGEGGGEGGQVGGQLRRPPLDRLDEKRPARQRQADRQDSVKAGRRAGRLGTAEAGRLIGKVLGGRQRPLRKPRHAEHEPVPLQAVMRVRDAFLAHRHEIVGSQATQAELERAGRVARQHGGEGGKVGLGGQVWQVWHVSSR